MMALGSENLTPDKLYERGYADGFNGVDKDIDFVFEDSYMMGYEDGRGDKESGADTKGVKSSFIRPDVVDQLDPPAGYRFTGEHRTPDKGEVYLTKAGNAGVAKDDPKNGRQRHILKADQPCGRGKETYIHSYYPKAKLYGPCKFAVRHGGRCSWELVK
jgi:hypothetical protein